MQVSNYASSAHVTSYQESNGTKYSAQPMAFLKEKMDEMLEKIKNGDAEPTYQIGAQSFTEKEWDEFLGKFDSIEDMIRKLMRERQEREEEEQIRNEQMQAEQIQTEQMQAEQITKEQAQTGQTANDEANVMGDTADLLTTESTVCTYPATDPKNGEIRYITWYTEEGIFCRKAGQTVGYEWSVPFENKDQYDKVMELIGRFPADWNMRFAAHQNFWTDFLNDEIDMDEFMKFMEGTNKGVPDYSITIGDSVYVDKNKAQWAQYLNPLGSKFYTAEEFHRQQKNPGR